MSVLDKPLGLAICLEDLSSRDFTRCTALRGRQQGLGLTDTGKLVWQMSEQTGLELWVSGDEQLVLYRREQAGACSVHREGRSLNVPPSKPVILLDQDELTIAQRRLRVHVHGFTSRVSEPTELRERSAIGAVAVAVAIGAMAMACGKSTSAIEVRDQPPAPPPTEPRDSGVPEPSPGDADFAADAGLDAGDQEEAGAKAKDGGGASDASGKAGKRVKKKPPIEVRNHPPDMQSED